jgi:hypothetical protein
MQALVHQQLANVGWTSFSGVWSTVFPLVVLIVVLSIYTVAFLLRERE